jgi:hypothetical protein
MKLDEKNGNTKWQVAFNTELSQMDKYKTFIDKEHQTKTKPPHGYKFISSLMSSTMADIKLGLWLTNILLMLLWNKSIQEWFACAVSARFSSFPS